jgi:hypothetical protein
MRLLEYQMWKRQAKARTTPRTKSTMTAVMVAVDGDDGESSRLEKWEEKRLGSVNGCESPRSKSCFQAVFVPRRTGKLRMEASQGYAAGGRGLALLVANAAAMRRTSRADMIKRWVSTLEKVQS